MIRKYTEIFCWKNVSSFCSAKATHIFSAKNIRILYIESAKTVNEMTLKELVKLTMLWTTGPWCRIAGFQQSVWYGKSWKAHPQAPQAQGIPEYCPSGELFRGGTNPFRSTSTVLSTSLGKTFFAWRFILNENILFWLTISYQKPFRGLSARLW